MLTRSAYFYSYSADIFDSFGHDKEALLKIETNKQSAFCRMNFFNSNAMPDVLSKSGLIQKSRKGQQPIGV
jgi:hypothetical protein